jgi:FMN hydrolase / 5-amino-6-(5-phospho-D-ribitylamino)uracil phosphatase
MTVDAVIFDWGGTLTPWHTIDPAAPWRAYAEVVQPDDPQPLTSELIAAEAHVWAAVKHDQTSATFADVLAAAGADHDIAATDAYMAAWEPHTFTDPDVPALFTDLRSRGIRIGVLSNTIWPREWHEGFFARDGVLDLVDAGVYSCEIPYTKPHREAFGAAMTAVGVADPQRCVFVGDRPYDDISGAAAVGMRAVLVPHSDIPPEQQVPVDVTPDAVISRLGDLTAHVDAWTNGQAK